ncbi:MAG TPA: hypothetical protein VFO79_11740, partial [Xanthomonadales bacterium]|nr:hypothetical protein [Xanthomonadales bacterium]
FNLGLAAMLTAIASEAELSPAESQQFSQLVLGVQRWAGGIDWSDASRVDRVLAAASGFVRRSGLASPRQVADLPYERALALGDDAIATAKLVLRAYDFDLDALLASISFEELERDGSTATVRTRLVAFGVPLDVTRELTWRRGRWSDARHHGHGEPEAKPASISITVD